VKIHINITGSQNASETLAKHHKYTGSMHQNNRTLKVANYFRVIMQIQTSHCNIFSAS